MSGVVSEFTEFRPCNHCGIQTTEADSICVNCKGQANPYAGPAMQQQPYVDAQNTGNEKPDLGMRLLLPVGRSGFAIAAGYLGLFSVLFLPAPLALLFGILAVRDIQKNPKKSGLGRAIFGIVMGVIFTLLLGLSVTGNLPRF